MTNCKKCEHHSCLYAGADRILSVECGTYTPHHKPKKPQTNADRIRAMSDEEMAKWMAECNAYRENADASQWLPWLKQPAEEVDDG